MNLRRLLRKNVMPYNALVPKKNRKPKKVLLAISSILLLPGIVVLSIVQAGSREAAPATDNDKSANTASTLESVDSAVTTSPAETPATKPNPAITTPPKAPAPAAPTPSSVLNLKNWKLTLPIDTGHAGKPDEITQPELAKFTNSAYFWLNSTHNGVIFQANVNGATTSNSGYPRSELREMTSTGQPASWSNSSGTHTMIIRQAITHLPVAKPDVVAGQIHNSSDDVIEIRLLNKQLFVKAGDKELGDLNSNYTLGTVFTVKVVAASGHIRVYYNDVQKVDYAKSGSGYYFKAGCYTQSNLSKGDLPVAYGQVEIYGLEVSHH